MRHSITENMFYCNILLQINIIGNQTAFATPPPPETINLSIHIFIFHLFQGCSPKLRKLGLISKWLPQLVCILALNATKEAIMTNHQKRIIDLLLMTSTQLDMSHIQSYTNSMRNIMILTIRSILRKKKSVWRQ